MNLREVILGIAIFVLTLFVTTYGVNMFYNAPDYNDFCDAENWKLAIQDETSCIEQGGEWNDYAKVVDEEVRGNCDLDFTCREDYEIEQEKYSMKIFLVAVPLGILLILLGAYFFSLTAIGSGIMAGGVGTILRGISSYWRYSEDWIRFLISLFGLVVLIYFGYKFSDLLDFEKRKKK